MYVTSGTTEQQAKGLQIIGETHRSFEAVRRDSQLSDQGKRQRLRQLHTNPQAQLSQLEAEESRSLEARRERIRGQLFGPKFGIATEGYVASARDARDRASKLTDVGDALRVLADAEEAGDAVLAQAVAKDAYRRAIAPLGDAWGAVLDVWTGDDQAMADLIGELARLEGVGGSAITDGLSRAMAFTVSEPHELRGWRADSTDA
jgi:hypothetical protein